MHAVIPQPPVRIPGQLDVAHSGCCPTCGVANRMAEACLKEVTCDFSQQLAEQLQQHEQNMKQFLQAKFVSADSQNRVSVTVLESRPGKAAVPKAACNASSEDKHLNQYQPSSPSGSGKKISPAPEPSELPIAEESAALALGKRKSSMKIVTQTGQIVEVDRDTANEGVLSAALEKMQSHHRTFRLAYPKVDWWYRGIGARSESTTWLREAFHTVATSFYFECGQLALILLNAISIAIQADWLISNIEESPPAAFKIIDLCFNTFFSVELVIRFIDEQMFFFSYHNINIRWNAFDSFSVLSSWAEELMTGDNGLPNFTGARTLRVFRLMRILRIIRIVRFFREFRMMADGILNSLRSLAWCVLLLGIIVLMMSQILLQIISDTLRSDSERGQSRDGSGTVMKMFGGVLQSAYTLFQGITGGLDWGTAADALGTIDPWLRVLFIMYLSFALMCVLNVVTSVFVDKANQFNKKDMDVMVLEEINNREEWYENLRSIFADFHDDTEPEMLNRQDFIFYVQDQRVQAYLQKLGLNVEKDNANALFSLIDIGCTGMVSLEDFIDGSAQFVGAARQLDIARLRYEVRQVSELVHKLMGGLGIPHEQPRRTEHHHFGVAALGTERDH